MSGGQAARRVLVDRSLAWPDLVAVAASLPKLVERFVVPADAWPDVVPLARLVLTREGGRGCVREFCDAVWRAKLETAA